MSDHPDRNGNLHDDLGRFVTLRDFVERIFAEKDASAEFKRLSLERALDQAKDSTALALSEARVNVEQKLIDAKVAADAREVELRARLDKLESGGAPFANRLDEGVSKLRNDVDTLNVDAVRTKVLDALRLQHDEEAKQQKKQTRAALVAACTSLAIAAITVIINLLH